MNTTPVSLLERLRRPADPEAWARFVHLYTPLLVRWARHLRRSDADAADLVQEVFLILVRKLPEFHYDPGQSFRAWLRTVTINKWRDLCSHRTAQPLDEEDPALVVADHADLFNEAEYRSYLSRRALQLIQREFQPLTWRAFWECVVADRPPAEVASDLGVTLNAVYLAKCRVLRRLREELNGLLD